MRTTCLLLRAVFAASQLEVQACSLESSWAKLLPTNDCTFHRLPSQLSKLSLLYHGGQGLGESWISQASPCSVTVWKEEPIHWWNSLERLMDPGLGPRQCPLAYYLFLQADIVSTSSLVLWSFCFVPSRESMKFKFVSIWFINSGCYFIFMSLGVHHWLSPQNSPNRIRTIV